MKTQKCLACGHKVEVATDLEQPNNAPKPGNIAICIDCGHLMAFADDMSFRELRDDEMLAVAGDPDILMIQKVRGMAKEEMRKRTEHAPIDKITELFAIIAVHDNGGEGIVADAENNIPLLSSRPRHKDILIQAAKTAMNSHGHFKLARFQLVEVIKEFGAAPTSHVYPSQYPPGKSPELNIAWDILDTFNITVSDEYKLNDTQRALLAGMIAGRLSRQ